MKFRLTGATPGCAPIGEGYDPPIVNPTLRRLLGQALGSTQPGRTLSGFVDGLLQTFENCRAGLPDARLAQGGEDVELFFLDLYSRETSRLGEIVERDLGHLQPQQRRELMATVDLMIKNVVLPAYTRHATTFTRRERNDFYLAPASLHGVERMAWAGVGVALGTFVVWAPFIPIWSKEWVLIFFVGGLVFPELRRVMAMRRYQAELNRIVARTDQEIWRREMAYLTSGDTLGGAALLDGEASASQSEPGPAVPEEQLAERLASGGPASTGDRRVRAHQGDD